MTNAYRRGGHATTAVRCTVDPAHVRLDIGASEGSYSAHPAQRDLILRLWLAQPPARIELIQAGQDGHPAGRRPERARATSGCPSALVEQGAFLSVGPATRNAHQSDHVGRRPHDVACISHAPWPSCSMAKQAHALLKNVGGKAVK